MNLSTPTSSLFSLFFNAPPPTEIYTLSLHDALPISRSGHTALVAPPGRLGLARRPAQPGQLGRRRAVATSRGIDRRGGCLGQIGRHTSELQSQSNLVCRLLLEKKKKKYNRNTNLRTI